MLERTGRGGKIVKGQPGAYPGIGRNKRRVKMKTDSVQMVEMSNLHLRCKEVILQDIARWRPPRSPQEKRNFEDAVQNRIDDLMRIPEPPPGPNSNLVVWKYHWSVGRWRQHSANFPGEEL
jgi:hypothetical protein